MKTLLVLTTTVTIILIVIILQLLLKIRILTKKSKYADEANMWHKLAMTDELTGLYNRFAYNSYIEKNKRNFKHTQRAIILFDIDDFKAINDTKGHLAGDVALQTVADTLSEIFSSSQYRVFRIGGDEFSVLTKGVSEKDIKERLRALKKRLNTDTKIGLSFGYSFIKDTPKDAFICADKMLYAHKRSKKLQSFSSENK